VLGIKNDSREITSGDIFVAIKGESVDGHRYIPNAVERGAVAVVGTAEICDLSIPYIRVKNSREALAWLAAAFFDHPARRLRMIGVTGTDGKTTTCNLLFNCLKATGLKTGLISTVNAVIMDQEIDTGFHVTTPEAMDIQCYLKQMLDAGITHVVLETTSHGLAQHRVTGCEYDMAVVTNITHEHLDYHGSYEAYLGAKAILFEMLKQTAVKEIGNLRFSVLNADDASFEALEPKVGTNFVSYSTRGLGTINAENIEYFPDSLRFTAVGRGLSLNVDCPFPGEFNVSNCLAAISAAVLGLGVSPEAAARGIAHTMGVPGRMQRIDLGQSFAAIVDFAHTPNALH
ncbi:UDP-N-acetylmuramoyl-L-alanyl-D-glutamate--2,6-diaminopimelate ligase, partial [bacterium]|nr:UDP-N-acetylmuramoyl-L-alanyl-D-glutamate--2,6-diaminopimelate ligase [bacterium]